MAARLCKSISGARRTKTGGFHLKRLEKFLLKQLFPRLVHSPLGHVAGNRKSGVGVNIFFTGRGFGGFDEKILQKQLPRTHGRPAIGPKLCPDLIVHDIAGDAATIGEQLLERDRSILLVHFVFQLGECLGKSAIPRKLPVLYQHRAQRSRQRLGARANVEAVVEGDSCGIAAAPNPGRATGDNRIALDQRGHHARDVVFDDDRLEQR